MIEAEQQDDQTKDEERVHFSQGTYFYDVRRRHDVRERIFGVTEERMAIPQFEGVCKKRASAYGVIGGMLVARFVAIFSMFIAMKWRSPGVCGVLINRPSRALEVIRKARLG